MTITLRSHSPDETFRIGETIGRQLKGREIILIKGELGAGKTLLTKGIAQALGINPRDVVSPTFTLVNEFRSKRQRLNSTGDDHGPQDDDDEHRLFHVDLYRLGPTGGNHLPEIDDHLDEGVIVVEWAQFLNPSYFKLDRYIEISLLLVEENENTRDIHIDSSLPLIFPMTVAFGDQEPLL